jgi:deazaflavin-dependent oxidoreductase (nitroreductase family)
MTTEHTRPSEPTEAGLTAAQRFWRNRQLARARHSLARLRRFSASFTGAHALAIRLSGGRIRRSFLFTGGMPILVLTTVGRKSGQRRSTPVGYLKVDSGFAVLASNAGSDHVPAWWLNLQAHPVAEVLADRVHYQVTARPADPIENHALWGEFARLNPGFDEYRNLTERTLPVVLLEPTSDPS